MIHICICVSLKETARLCFRCKWMDAISSSQVYGVYCSVFTQKQLEQFLEQHPEIEEPHIPCCLKVTDLSALAGMRNVRYVKISKRMESKIGRA